MKHSTLSLLASAVLANALLLNPAHADRLMPTATLQGGGQLYEISLGLGSWNTESTKYSQFYVSYFDSHTTNHVDGKSMGHHPYRSTRFGFASSGFGFGKNQGNGGGVFLYSNQSSFNIDRAGIGFNLELGKMIGTKTRMHAGVVLMPEFLSTDWDANALLEYEVNAGLTYRISRIFDLSAKYRYGATTDSSLDVEFYNRFLASFSWRM